MTQQDPDHGEAWNNIAAIWVQLDRNKEAFSALGECIKHKRENWQVGGRWERGEEGKGWLVRAGGEERETWAGGQRCWPKHRCWPSQRPCHARRVTALGLVPLFTTDAHTLAACRSGRTTPVWR